MTESYKHTRTYSLVVMFICVCLQAVTLTNLFVFTPIGEIWWWYCIPGGIFLFTLSMFFFMFITHRLFFFGFLISHVFGIIIPACFSYSIYFLVFFMKPEITPKLHVFAVFDILQTSFIFQVFLWPSMNYFLKMGVVLVGNIPLCVLLLLNQGISANAVNFFFNFVTSSVGFYFFHVALTLFHVDSLKFSNEMDSFKIEFDENERLLRKVLPDFVLSRLRAKKNLKHLDVRDGTCVFAIVKSLTGNMVSENFLDELFVSFDDHIQQHSAFKIKNVGSTYLFVTGLDSKETDSKDKAAIASIGLVNFFNIIKKKYAKEHIEEKKSVESYVISIGIHSGHFQSGIIGASWKMKFDCFGDVINLSFRLADYPRNDNRITCTDAFQNGVTQRRFEETKEELDLKGKGLTKVCYLSISDSQDI